MATKLFLRSAAGNSIGGTFKDLLITAGSSLTTGVTSTVASATEIQCTTATSGGTVLEWISPQSPAGGWTLSGTVTFNLWAFESSTPANAGMRVRLFKRTAAGSVTEIGGGPFDKGTELPTAVAVQNWTGTPTSTAFAEDDRLIVRAYVTNIGTMGGSRNVTLDYNGGTAAADGDTWVQLTENVTFKNEPINVTVAEAVSSADTPSAIFTTSGTVAETGSATDTVSTPTSYAVSLAETGSAADAVNATVVPPGGVTPSIITLPRLTRSAQPKGVVRVNRDHSMASRLKFATLGSNPNYEITRGLLPSISLNTTLVQVDSRINYDGRANWVAMQSGSTIPDVPYWTYPEYSVDPGTGSDKSFSFFWKGTQRGSTNDTITLIRVGFNYGWFSQLQGWSPDNYSFTMGRIWGGGAITSPPTVSVPLGIHSFAGSYDASTGNITLYQNGQKIGDYAMLVDPGTMQSQGVPRFHSSYVTAGYTGSPAAAMNVVMAFTGTLSSLDMKSLHENPYQLFESQQRFVPVDGSAGGGGPFTYNVSVSETAAATDSPAGGNVTSAAQAETISAVDLSRVGEPGTIVQHASNTLSSQSPYPANKFLVNGSLNQFQTDGQGGSVGFSGIFAYSGFCFAPDWGSQGSLVACGGGHGDYYGNGIFRYDVASATWSMVRMPLLNIYSDGSNNFNANDGYGEFYSSSLTNLQTEPVAAHTYDNMFWLPPNQYGAGSQGALLSLKRDAPATGGAPDNLGKRAQMYDVASNTWSRYSTNEISSYAFSGNLYQGPPTAFDTTRGKIYVLDENAGVIWLDLSTQAYSNTGSASSGFPAVNANAGKIAYYAAADLLVWVSDTGDRVVTMEPGVSLTTWHQASVSGAIPSANCDRTWVESEKCFVLRQGNATDRTFWRLQAPATNPKTGTWTMTSEVMTGTPTPDQITTGNPPTAHLRYVPAIQKTLWLALPGNYVLASSVPGGMSSSLHSVSQSESISASDAPVASTTLTAAQTESTSAADSQSSVISTSATQSESVSAADTASTSGTSTLAVSEASSAADTPAASYSTSAVLSESGAGVDTTSANYSTSAVLSESGAGVDNPAATMATNGTVAESASSTDTAAVGNISTAAQVESVTSSDTTSATGIMVSSMTESVAAADSQSGTALLIAAQVESLTATDTQSGITATSAVQSESGTAIDTANFGAASSSAAVTENAAAADTQAASGVMPAAMTEAGTALENTSATRATAAAVSESGAASEVQDYGSNTLNTTITEAASASESATATNQATASVVESLTAIDTISASMLTAAAVMEAMVSTDSAAASVLRPVSWSDSLSVLDSLSSLTTNDLLTVETVSLADTYGTVLMATAGMVETLAAVDTLVGGKQTTAAVTETATSTDLFNSIILAMAMPVMRIWHIQAEDRIWTVNPENRTLDI